jgi:thiamine biosynthesis protein ThiS
MLSEAKHLIKSTRDHSRCSGRKAPKQRILDQSVLKTNKNIYKQNMSTIKIRLNGEDKFLAQKTSIENLIEELGLDIKKIAVEKNYEIVIPEEFKDNILSEGDQIEIVHFIGGG